MGVSVVDDGVEGPGVTVFLVSGWVLVWGL